MAERHRLLLRATTAPATATATSASRSATAATAGTSGLRRRFRPGERPALASTWASATTTTRPSRPSRKSSTRRNPTGVNFPRTDLYTWKNFSPRFGFNLKLTADGRTVLKGHWGRYHRAIATGEYANVIGPNVKPFFAGTDFDFDADVFNDLTFLSGQHQPWCRPQLPEPTHRPVHPEPGARTREGPGGERQLRPEAGK